MNSWLYEGRPLDEIPEGIKAFVYVIEFNDGKFYYGKKQFYKSIKRPPLKGYKRHRRDTVESNWRKYCSSSNKVKQLVSEGREPTRKILRLCTSLKEASWYENKLLYEDITTNRNLNDNIQGKFFKEEIMKWNQ